MSKLLPAHTRQGLAALGHSRSHVPFARRATAMLVLGILSGNAAAQTASLAPVEVRTEGLRASEAGTASKSATALEQLPRSVSVVTETEMKARDAQSVMEALAYMPGVYGSGYESAALTREYPMVRGFLAYQYLDGLKLHDSNWAEEPFGLERVELLRGPASALYGQGSPGGLINMRSKRPTAETVREAGVRVGSHNLRQAQFDLGGAINADASWQYRLTGLVRKSEGEIDHTEADRRYFAGALSWKPSAATQLTLLANHQQDPSLTVHQPLPRLGTILPGANGQYIPRSRFLGEPSRHDSHKDAWRVGYEFSHRFNNVWSIEQNAAYKEVDIHVDEMQATGVASGATGWTRRLFAAEYRIVTKQIDTRLVGNFEAAGTKHRVMFGYDAARIPNYQGTGTRTGAFALDLYNPVYGQAVLPANPITSLREQRVRQSAFYVQDQFQWGQLSVLAGLRRDNARLDQKTAAFNPGTGITTNPPYARKRDMATTGQFGLGYALAGGWTPFLNYAESFSPVLGSAANGRAFDPQSGKQLEAGVKWTPPGRAIVATASVYEIKQRNLLTADLANPGFATQGQAVRTRGGEVEVKAGLSRGLDAMLAYSSIDPVVTASNTANVTGKKPVGLPGQMLTAWMSYRIAEGALQGLTLSAGLRHMGESAGDATNTFEVPSATVLDIGVRWSLVNLSPSLKGWDTSFAVKNVADKRYVANCDNASNCYYGTGRRVSLTASKAF